MYNRGFLNLHVINLYSGSDGSTGSAGSSTRADSFSSKRRDKFYIIAEILEIAKDGVLKTQIMYRANLSFTQLNDYLKYMLKNELIEKHQVNEKEVYKTAHKGINFLQSYREIKELFKTEPDDKTRRIPPENILAKKRT